MERTLGSIRVRLALGDLEEQRFDCPSVCPWRVDEFALTPLRTARLWYYEDLQRHMEAAYDGHPSEAFERRRSDLSTVFAMLRANRASDLSDLGWCPDERRHGVDERRRTYHWLRAVIRAYEALCREQATALRRLANAIMKPLPAPRPRLPDPPKEPYRGVHPDHLTARIQDISGARCVSVVAEDASVTARWFTPIDNPSNLAKLRGELDFIMSPAKVSAIDSMGVTMTWEPLT